MNAASRDRLNGFHCATTVLLAIALTLPFVESGVNDDWSYTKTAFDLARSGHLRYNGWAAAMLGAQAYWGAAFIKLFGFSFFVTRLSTAPLAAGCALLLYALHRRAKLPPHLAIFGTLTITLSPLFIPHAATFMTEVPSLFLLLLSFYSYARVAEMLQDPPAISTNRRSLVLWILAATVSGLLAGTVRQAFWILPVLAPLYLIFLQSGARFRALSIFLASLSLLSLLAGAGLTARFNVQPYTIHERVGVALSSLLHHDTPFYFVRQLFYICVTLGALTLPILIALSGVYGKISKLHRAPVIFGIGCVALGLLLTVWRIQFDSRFWIPPWLPNTFTIKPYLSGSSPVPTFGVGVNLSWPFWKAFCALTIFLASTAACAALATSFWPPRTKFHLGEGLRKIPPATALLAVFASAYVPLLLLKSLVPNGAGLFDRYLLPLLPLATILPLIVLDRFHQRNFFLVCGWGVLALVAYYGIAQTHDYFALLRARLKLTNALEARGIPRTAIMGGFEYDGWTQITLAPHYNDPRIESPAFDYIPPSPLSFQTEYIFWQSTPIVQAKYIIGLAEHRDLIRTDLRPATYSAWLPPFRRRCLVQVTDPQLAAIRSLPLVIERGR